MTTTRLTRDLDEAMLGGVLAGVAARYDWDVTLVRIVAVLVTLAAAVIPAVILYLVAWVMIPTSGAMETDDMAAMPEANGSSEAVEAAETAAATAPGSAAAIADDVAETPREAADRIGEAASIAAEAARRAATDIGEVARRPQVAVDDPLASDADAEEPISDASDGGPADAADDDPTDRDSSA